MQAASGSQHGAGNCARCGAPLRPGLAFCTQCGAPAAAAAAATPAAVAPPAPPAQPTRAAQPLPAAQSPPAAGGGVLGVINQDPTGLIAAAVIFAVCAAVSWVGWTPLSWPPRVINSVVPQGNCMSFTPGTVGMYLCSAGVAALLAVGPLLTILLIFLLRSVLVKAVKGVTASLPSQSHFLIVPVVATILFTIPWAGIHYNLSGQWGLLPQAVFPAVVGVFTFATARFNRPLQSALGPLFKFRDLCPVWLRFAAAAMIPLLLSLVITFQDRVSQEALKEQFIVLVSLLTGYLVLARRDSGKLPGVKQ
jgi:hypothetical protein